MIRYVFISPAHALHAQKLFPQYLFPLKQAMEFGSNGSDEASQMKVSKTELEGQVSLRLWYCA
jgi:hypothetical protein